MYELINLVPVKGKNLVWQKKKKWKENQANKNYEKLHLETLTGFLMTTLKKLPQIKSDLARTDDKRHYERLHYLDM